MPPPSAYQTFSLLIWLSITSTLSTSSHSLLLPIFFFFKLHERHPKFLRTTNTFFMPLLSCSLSPNHQQNWSPNDLHTVISCHMMIWHFEILGTCMCVCVGSHYFLFPLPFPGLRVFKPSFVYLCFQVTLF